jgi:thiol-disulfide isomerase/thioredoxin
VAIGLVVLVGIAAIVFAALAGSDGASTDTAGGGTELVEETAPAVEVTGDALPRFEGSDDAAVGLAFPTMSGEDLAGESMTIGGTGRPTLVMFVAHWCPHCQREVPVVQDWVDAGNLPDGVDLVAVSTSIDPSKPNYPSSTWLAEEGWTAPTLVDPDSSAAVAAGLSSYPFFVVVNGGGTVVVRTTGELTTDQLDQLVTLSQSA